VGYPFNFKTGSSLGLAGFRVANFARNRATNSTLLQAPFFADLGWPGGPALNLNNDEGFWILGCIVRDCYAPPGEEEGCAGARITSGKRMDALVTFGMVKWTPKEGWGFSDWGGPAFDGALNSVQMPSGSKFLGLDSVCGPRI